MQRHQAINNNVTVGVTRNTDSRCPDQCLTQRRQPTTDSGESKKSEIPLIDLGQHQ